MKRVVILALVLLSCLAPVARPQARPQCGNKIITFDAPGAGSATGQGTFAFGIVQGEWIVGNYIDANGVYHGFLRALDGTITTFDPPGAGTGAGQGTSEVRGMNSRLEIAGTYIDANNVYHSFLRTRRGKFTTFDAPGAGTGIYQGTETQALSAAGVILGDYWGADDVYHGLLIAPDGTFTTFDPPDAGKGAFQGVYPAVFSGINPEGANVGEYVDANYAWHAYLRAPDGIITEFDDPNAISGGGTGSLGINPTGVIWGWYFDANSVFHGFLRAPDGTITEVDAPGAGAGIGQGTTACVFMACLGAISPAGTVTSGYADANNVVHGFLRTRQSKFTTFDAPGAGTGNYQGTQPTGINAAGAITGFYVDANGVYHGFLRRP